MSENYLDRAIDAIDDGHSSWVPTIDGFSYGEDLFGSRDVALANARREVRRQLAEANPAVSLIESARIRRCAPRDHGDESWDGRSTL